MPGDVSLATSIKYLLVQNLSEPKHVDCPIAPLHWSVLDEFLQFVGQLIHYFNRVHVFNRILNLVLFCHVDSGCSTSGSDEALQDQEARQQGLRWLHVRQVCAWQVREEFIFISIL